MSSKGCQPIDDVGEFLAKRATTVDMGDVIALVSKTPLGIEWQSSKGEQWFIFSRTASKLVQGWDGHSSVCWFWEAHLSGGTIKKAHIVVPPHLMMEIKQHLADSL